MRITVVGCSHRTAPVGLRERMAFDDAACRKALSDIGLRYPCCESVLLSTCNRTELYLARPEYGHPRTDEAAGLLAGLRGIPLHEINPVLYRYSDSGAVRHLFRVAGSLDSLVVGEPQILGQVKKAFRLARARRAAGGWMTALFHGAFAAARKVHADTGIAGGHVSVGSVAADFIRQIFAAFDDKTVLMVGAGEMGEATLRHVLELRPRRILVTNRTPARAEDLASRIGGEAVSFDGLPGHLAESDIVVSSTGSSEPILGRGTMERVMSRRRYRPMVVLDIAVPRDIEEGVGKLDQVFLYNVDDLQRVAEDGLERRCALAGRAEKIIDEAVRGFAVRQEQQRIGPVLRALDEHFGDIGCHELEWLRHKLPDMTAHQEETIRWMVHRMMRKLMHEPAQVLGEEARNGDVVIHAETLKSLFRLPEELPRN